MTKTLTEYIKTLLQLVMAERVFNLYSALFDAKTDTHVYMINSITLCS